MGKPRAFSKSRSAAAVSAPGAPPVLIGYPSLTRAFCAVAISRGESLFPPARMISAIGSAVRGRGTDSFAAPSPAGRCGGAGGAVGGGSDRDDAGSGEFLAATGVKGGREAGSGEFLAATGAMGGLTVKNGEGWRAC